MVPWNFRNFTDRTRFSSQCRLVNAEAGFLDDPGVGGDIVAFVEKEQVSGHDLLGGDIPLDAGPSCPFPVDALPPGPGLRGEPCRTYVPASNGG